MIFSYCHCECLVSRLRMTQTDLTVFIWFSILWDCTRLEFFLICECLIKFVNLPWLTDVCLLTFKIFWTWKLYTCTHREKFINGKVQTLIHYHKSSFTSHTLPQSDPEFCKRAEESVGTVNTLKSLRPVGSSSISRSGRCCFKSHLAGMVWKMLL